MRTEGESGNPCRQNYRTPAKRYGREAFASVCAGRFIKDAEKRRKITAGGRNQRGGKGASQGSEAAEQMTREAVKLSEEAVKLSVTGSEKSGGSVSAMAKHNQKLRQQS